MRINLCVAPALLISIAAFADSPSKEGRAILEKSREALKKVDLVSYHFEYKLTGQYRFMGGAAEGSMILGKPSEYGVNTFRCDINLESPNEIKPIKLTVGADGDVYFLIDHAIKMVYEDMDIAVLGRRGQQVQPFVVGHFIADNPFEAELAAEEIALVGSESMGEEECHLVRVKAPRGADPVWFISKKDYLPRGFRRTSMHPQDPKKEWGARTLMLTNVKANPKIDEKVFKTDVPDGYTKTDDYAR